MIKCFSCQEFDNNVPSMSITVNVGSFNPSPQKTDAVVANNEVKENIKYVEVEQ